MKNNRYVGFLLMGSNDIRVKNIGDDRLINEEDLNNLLQTLNITYSLDSLEEYRHKENGYLYHRALIDLVFQEYLHFNNEAVEKLFDALTIVGLIPLIDEATGYQYVRKSNELSLIFNKNLRGDEDA